MTMETTVHLAGIVTLVGAVLYALADVLLLAHHIGPRQAIPSTAIDLLTRFQPNLNQTQKQNQPNAVTWACLYAL